LLGLNEVVALFALLKRDIQCSSKIPSGKHELVWQRLHLQGADPDIAACLNAYLKGGDIQAARSRMRERLSELLRFEDSGIDVDKVVALVVGSIESNLSKAAVNDRDASSIEHALTRAATAAGLAEVRLQLDAMVDALRRQHAGGGDYESAFVRWLVEHFAQIRTAGLGTSRHLQLPLADVFVAAQGVRESIAGVRWPTRAQRQLADLRERLRSGTLAADEYEVWLDRLGVEDDVRSAMQAEPVSVAGVLRDADRAVVLGDPGIGKTTLLRYLAFRHAQALRDGESVVSEELGVARLPIYLRAGEFVRWPDRERGLGAFITQFVMGTMHCPLDEDCVRQLLAAGLQAGRCLVLIDGLDEVSSAAERAGVVDNIASFVAAQQPQGNRFVCTSRISGYGAAPLPASFAGVRLLEMNDDAIERFLRAYVPAIERWETGDKVAEAIVARDAERTVAQLLEAFARSPGVRRLAGNPLLLTALLLVHRTHGNLPQRRVDAYKAVADALGHSWRAYHGVPDTELPDERRLTGWLTRLAEWMHAERPEGSATLRDLLQVLGPSWAQLNRLPWDASVLDEADPASTEAGVGILQFVEQVDRHCGLLVERAPRRWGFPHLTFEEFYAGRALAFSHGHDRAVRIRKHLHDARYDEPILLALGLVGIDYADQIDELIETALLSRSNEAVRLGLQPSLLEGLLGRDFRFALRALADDIPASPHVVDELITQAIDEALLATGRGRFELYHRALLDRIDALKTVGAGTRLADLLAQRINTDTLARDDTRNRFIDLTARCPAHPAITRHLMSLLERTDDPWTAVRAARVLGAQGPLPDSVIDRFIELIARTDNWSLADSVTRVLGGQGSLPEGVVDRLVELIASSGDWYVADRAARVLSAQGPLPEGVVDRVAELIASRAESYVAVSAALVLSAQGPLPEGVIDRVAELIASRAESYVADTAAGVLSAQGPLPEGVIDRLAELIGSKAGWYVADRAARVLSAQGPLPERVMGCLIKLVTTNADGEVASGQLGCWAGRVRCPPASSTASSRGSQ
jgi:hypothetical protein